jgi:hypothetical protein
MEIAQDGKRESRDEAAGKPAASQIVKRSGG